MFLGHVNDIADGNYTVLQQDRCRSALVNRNGEYFQQNNLCTHQGSQILTDRGVLSETVCPYHGYSWDVNGNPTSSGTVGHSRGSSLCKNTAKLWQRTCTVWNGFLFSKPLPVDIDITGQYELVEYRQDNIKSSTFPVMDLFLDIDHIPIVHPGVYDRIDIPDVEDISWQTWDGGSAQLVAGEPDSSSIWHSTIAGKVLTHSAAWIALYPHTMFEWQPGAVFVMVNEPVADDRTVSHVFKYRDHNYSYENWLINESVWEEAWVQDRQQAELLEPGWRLAGESNLDPEKRAYRRWMSNVG